MKYINYKRNKAQASSIKEQASGNMPKTIVFFTLGGTRPQALLWVRQIVARQLVMLTGKRSQARGTWTQEHAQL
jgi:hypothetical protein